MANKQRRRRRRSGGGGKIYSGANAVNEEDPRRGRNPE